MILNAILVFVLTFVAMECASWLIHKYVLHGFLWFMHKSHHTPRHGIFEINDLVGIVYALIAAVLVYFGLESKAYNTAAVGFGISAYGLFYFIFHDVIIHRRIKMKYNFKNLYINRLIRAHKLHHKHQNKENGEAFGFLYATPKYKVTKPNN